LSVNTGACCVNSFILRTTTGGINLNIGDESHKFGQIAARNIRMSLDKRFSFLDVKLRQLPRKLNSHESKYDIRDKDLPTVRGTLGGSEHRNTAKQFGKYRNTAEKIAKYRNTSIPSRNTI